MTEYRFYTENPPFFSCKEFSGQRRVTLGQSGGAAFLVGLPVLSGLSFQAFRKVQRSAVVCALDKEEVLEQADYLYSCAETEKLYQLLLQYQDSEDAEFLWRLARASRDLSVLPSTDAGWKKQLVFEAFEYAKRALERDDKCFAAHKWYAICLSDTGEFQGIKVKIGNSYIIREHLERSIELNPKDATSLHILGYWCFAFAELPWYQRKVAAVIFSKPPTSTFEEALEFFLKAEEVDPNFYSKNLLMLGKTYMAMKDKEKALLWLTKAKEFPSHTLEDKEVHKEALELLNQL
ncbi:regulator of microtubule dynamics protein 1 isoform X2 [Girardinichthys multiradiatus]|uniref:regulator of microtubule dynamics protein 1 isoform X2 n=1 Tax=Girardinichthys multiradiatus TaxID=208333 RepID=UPI001FAE730A|nr:regulator of microtubule dynamics protein 1 isoform X2 [Girardinichthys multiradiatus]